MRLQVVVLLFLGFVLGPSAYASAEYLRLAGFAHEPCEDCGPSLAELGLVDGQLVYFDVLFDTDFDAPGYTDTSYQDYFFAVALDGTAIAGDSFASSSIAGRTNFYPEGTVSHFVGFGDNLLIGNTFDSLPYDGGADLSINTWTVGTNVSLYAFDTGPLGTGDGSVVRLSVRYRGATPPPPIPLPAAGWLMLTAVGLLGVMRRRKT